MPQAACHGPALHACQAPRTSIRARPMSSKSDVEKWHPARAPVLAPAKVAYSRAGGPREELRSSGTHDWEAMDWDASRPCGGKEEETRTWAAGERYLEGITIDNTKLPPAHHPTCARLALAHLHVAGVHMTGMLRGTWVSQTGSSSPRGPRAGGEGKAQGEHGTGGGTAHTRSHHRDGWP